MVIYSLPRVDLLRLFADHPDMGEALRAQLARRYREVCRQLGDISRHRARARLAHALAELAGLPPHHVVASRTDLAALAAMS